MSSSGAGVAWIGRPRLFVSRSHFAIAARSCEVASPFMFVDRVTIQIEAGRGGDGCSASAARSTFPAAGPTAATAATAAA